MMVLAAILFAQAFAQDADLLERGGFPESGFPYQVIIGREADAEGVGGAALDQAAIGIDQFTAFGRRPAGGRGMVAEAGQRALVGVEAVDGVEHVGECLPAGFFLAGLLEEFRAIFPVLILHFNMGLGSRGLYGFGECEPLFFHKEMDGIAAGAAAETLEGVGGGEDGEGGCALRMERA